MSIDAQEAIIGRAIDSAESYDRISLTLGVADFTDARCRLIWELVSKLREAGREPDQITLAAMLGRSTRWAAIEGGDPLAYVQYLLYATPSGQLLDQYVSLVEDESAARRLRQYAETVARIANDGDLSAEAKLSAVQAALPSDGADQEGATVTYGKPARMALDYLRRRAAGEVFGIGSGLADLDELTGGFEAGTLTIVAGRPSHGKSIIAMQIAEAAAKHGPVFVFSVEMTASNLAQRAIASRGIDFGDMRHARIDESMDRRMSDAAIEMDDLPIVIDDRAGYSVDQLRSRVRMMARRAKPAMIVLDYLTLVSGVGENRTAQVGYVSRSLKAMSKEIGAPVVTVAQVNRGVESRPDKRPTSADLRDSGEIEQDADLICFTYLHEKYFPGSPRKGFGELVVTKNRNGPTGNVFTKWEGRYQRFCNHVGEVPPEHEEEDEPRRAQHLPRAAVRTMEPPF